MLLSTNKMTRNKVNKNRKMTREEMMEVSLQHMMHARLLWNHLVAAEEKIKRLEEEKEELKEELKMVKECASKKFTEQVQKSAVKQPRRTLFVADSHRKSVDFKSARRGIVCGASLQFRPVAKVSFSAQVSKSGSFEKPRFGIIQ